MGEYITAVEAAAVGFAALSIWVLVIFIVGLITGRR